MAAWALPKFVESLRSSNQPHSAHFTPSRTVITPMPHLRHFVNSTPSSGSSIVACIVPLMRLSMRSATTSPLSAIMRRRESRVEHTHSTFDVTALPLTYRMATANMADITIATVPTTTSPTSGTCICTGVDTLAILSALSTSAVPTAAALTLSPSSNVFGPASYSSMDAIASPGSIARPPSCTGPAPPASIITVWRRARPVRALVYDRYAEDDDFGSILSVRDIDPPRARPGEVVFRVRAAALNHDDIWGMRGRPIPVPMPHVSGTDAAGDVVEVGAGVGGLRPGDRVVSHGNLSCRLCRACASGREYDCRRRLVWGFQTGPMWGGFCELAHLPEHNAVRIPDGVGYDEAAAASMTMTTSWHMLVGRARVRPGQAVLVMGGGSGMGMFGVQIAKLHGCDVIATAGPGKLDRCLEIGADAAVDHRAGGWDDEVRREAARLARAAGRTYGGIDVIYEHVGGSHWGRELRLLRRGGTVVTTGATTGYDVRTDLRTVISEGLSILGSTQGTRAELERGLAWMARGRLRAVVDSVYPLERAAEAHRRMLRGAGLFGKIIMRP